MSRASGVYSGASFCRSRARQKDLNSPIDFRLQYPPSPRPSGRSPHRPLTFSPSYRPLAERTASRDKELSPRAPNIQFLSRGSPACKLGLQTRASAITGELRITILRARGRMYRIRSFRTLCNPRRTVGLRRTLPKNVGRTFAFCGIL